MRRMRSVYRMTAEHGQTPSSDFRQKTAGQAVFFANRLKKRAKHLRKWAQRNGIYAYRIYGRDIPEIPLDADLYEDTDTGARFLHLAFYRRKEETGSAEETFWLEQMCKTAAETLAIPPGQILLKIRERQRGVSAQYEKIPGRGISFFVREAGAQMKVNLSNYVDTGLFLDHRPLRMRIRKEAAGKSFLNLFCYTGGFSIQAAAGGAAAVTSVDLSKTYLAWAQENWQRNAAQSAAFRSVRWELVCSDVSEFLYRRQKPRRWDIILCDPPTFSNSKRTAKDLDVPRDWAELCAACLSRLNPGGVLYFSSNARRLAFDPAEIPAPPGTEIRCRDIMAETVDEDFKGKRPHRCWEIRLTAVSPAAGNGPGTTAGNA